MTTVPTDFQMFTPEGNVAASRLMAEFLDSLVTTPAKDEDEAYTRLSALIAGMAETHGEIYDTEVRHTMTYLLMPLWRSYFGTEINQWNIGLYEGAK